MLTANGGRPDRDGWPADSFTAYGDGLTGDGPTGDGRIGTVPHPDDPGVLLVAVGALRPGVADAVVGLCRLGCQVPLPGVAPEGHAEVWLVDKEDANIDLPLVLRDAAETVRQLRAEGKTVLLHRVHARTRTPVVAAAYGASITGSSGRDALARVLAVLPTRPRASIPAGLDGL